jgi:hypothetical protein
MTMAKFMRRYHKAITKKVSLALSLLCIIVCAGATASAGENESLSFQLSLDWKMANHAEQHGYVIMEYVRQGDDIHHWKELFTYQNFGLGYKRAPTIKDELDTWKAVKEKECPGATEWNVIEQSESSILYEWQEKPCLGWPDQHEIARIIFGKHNLFLLRYTAKVQQLDPDTRKTWIKTFADATIDTETKSVGSEDVDSIIPFEVDKVTAALKPAMESVDCKVEEATAARIECKRPRTTSGHYVYGGESVTALLEAQGSKTRVVITTGKGFYGRLRKRAWSIPIYQQMVKNLEQPQP